jgi:hypothetical protein
MRIRVAALVEAATEEVKLPRLAMRKPSAEIMVMSQEQMATIHFLVSGLTGSLD